MHCTGPNSSPRRSASCRTASSPRTWAADSRSGLEGDTSRAGASGGIRPPFLLRPFATRSLSGGGHVSRSVTLYRRRVVQGARRRRTEPVLNPATGETIGTVPHRRQGRSRPRARRRRRRASRAWRKVSAHERYKLMRKAADILRERADDDRRDHDAGAGQAACSRRSSRRWPAPTSSTGSPRRRAAPMASIIPARADGVQQLVVKEPVGPVAAFTPWNFPINQAVRKISAAVAAGCSIIIKGPEKTPGGLRRAGARLRRGRLAGGRGQSGLRRAGGDLGISHPASHHPQDLVHRLDRRSASIWPRSPAGT